MNVFLHHIYEYQKGLRKLVLYTGCSTDRTAIIARLEKHKIDYIITQVSGKKINVFFGSQECIAVLQNFRTLELDKISDSEDFILGVMLGYDVSLQCRRYVKRLELIKAG